MYEEVINGGLKETELMEGDGTGKNSVRENDVMENVVSENVVREKDVMETDGNDDNEQGGHGSWSFLLMTLVGEKSTSHTLLYLINKRIITYLG
ncbi:unnamed protein product [Lathyrus sativus]|nr:unnamed protein product [Lathyrus sativus]